MEKFLVLDTETCGQVNIDNSFCYDISWLVGDYDGNIYQEKAFVVADYFLDDDMMNSAYYKDKIPQYIEDIANGKRELRKINTIRNILYNVCKKYDIHKIYAYNIRFDYQVLLDSMRLANSSKYRYFLPYELSRNVNDIMKLGNALAKEDSYKNFCKENEYLTKNGRCQTKAEVVARYLFDNNFQEEHKGLEDCEIEHKILCELIKRYPNVDCQLWK